MTVLGIALTSMLIGIAVSPKSFGKTLAQIRKGYNEEMEK